MAEILQPQPNESIYDPTCGSGGMLVKCLDYLRNKGAEWQSVQVFGQEVNGLTSSIARMNHIKIVMCVVNQHITYPYIKNSSTNSNVVDY